MWLLSYFKNRTLFKAAFAFVVGLCLAVFCSCERLRPVTFFALAAAALCAALFCSKRGRRCAALLVLASVLLGFSYIPLYNFIFNDSLLGLAGTETEISAVAVSEPTLSSTGKSLSVCLKIRSLRTFESSEEVGEGSRIMAYFPPDSDISYGDGLRFSGTPELPNEMIEDFNYRRHLMSRGCCLIVYAGEFEKYEENLSASEMFGYLGNALRRDICDYCERITRSPESGALLSGIITGSRLGFDDEMYAVMSSSGFIHIVSVSGLHVSFLCTAVTALLKFIGMKKRSAVMILLLPVYISVAEFVPSVCRAVLMAIIVSGAVLADKSHDSLTTISAAALILCLVNPYQLFNQGFILSFMSTLSLILFMSHLGVISSYAALLGSNALCQKKNLASKFVFTAIAAVLNSVFISVSCQIAVMPLTSHYFGNAAWLSFLGNLAVVPLTMLVFVLSLLGYLLHCLTGGLVDPIFRFLIDPQTSLIYKISVLFSASGASVTQRAQILTMIIGYSLELVLLYYLTLASKKLSKKLKSPDITSL